MLLTITTFAGNPEVSETFTVQVPDGHVHQQVLRIEANGQPAFEVDVNVIDDGGDDDGRQEVVVYGPPAGEGQTSFENMDRLTEVIL